MNVVPKPQRPGSRRRAGLARGDHRPLGCRACASPTCRCKQTEDIFRIHALGLDWDMGVTVYEPADPAQIARGADGKKIGIFLLHGGSGDYKSMEPMAKLFAGKFGCKAVAMTFPGRLYLDDPSARLAGRHHQPGRHRAHADLAQGRAHHARPVRGRARHLDAHALRHAHRGARQARHDLLRPHGGMAGGVRGRHEGRHAPAFPGRRILDLPHRPFDRRADGVHDLAARAQRRRHDRGRELAVRLHPGGAAQLVGRARQGRGPRARDHEARRRAPIRSTSSTSAPGATARAMRGRRRSARKARRR